MGDIITVRDSRLQTSQHPGQRSGKPVHNVGNHRQTESGKPAGIAIGVDDQRRVGRHGAANDMRQQWLATKHHQVLVTAPHTSRLTACQQQIEW